MASFKEYAYRVIVMGDSKLNLQSYEKQEDPSKKEETNYLRTSKTPIATPDGDVLVTQFISDRSESKSIQGAQGAVITYDVNNSKSYHDALGLLRSKKRENSHLPCLVVGINNGMNSSPESEVDSGKAQKEILAAGGSFKLCTTDAENVDRMFDLVTQKIREKDSIQKSGTLKQEDANARYTRQRAELEATKEKYNLPKDIEKSINNALKKTKKKSDSPRDSDKRLVETAFIELVDFMTDQYTQKKYDALSTLRGTQHSQEKNAAKAKFDIEDLNKNIIDFLQKYPEMSDISKAKCHLLQGRVFLVNESYASAKETLTLAQTEAIRAGNKEVADQIQPWLNGANQKLQRSLSNVSSFSLSRALKSDSQDHMIPPPPPEEPAPSVEPYKSRSWRSAFSRNRGEGSNQNRENNLAQPPAMPPRDIDQDELSQVQRLNQQTNNSPPSSGRGALG